MAPRFIEDRIRKAPPDGAPVVPGSTPVLAFGDPAAARIATLGLNPSRLEFISSTGALLDGDRRFETLASLGVTDMGEAPASAVERVWNGCRGYFRRNPYRRWFDQLEAVLQAVGASYYAGTACHLDLVQWATDPTWARLDRRTIIALLDQDVPFLKRQLATSTVRLLLINGTAVMSEFERSFGDRLEQADGPLRIDRQTATIKAGRVSGICVVAWNLNLQSSYGVSNEMRARLTERIAAIIRQCW